MQERQWQAAFGTRVFYRCRTADALGARAVELLAEALDCEGGCFFVREATGYRRVASLRAEHPALFLPTPPADRELAAAIEAGRGRLVRPAARGGSDALPWRDRRGGPVLLLPCADADGETRALMVVYDRRAGQLADQDLPIGDLIAAQAAEAMRAIDETLRLHPVERSSRQLVDDAPTGICLVQDERIAYANPQMAEMLGMGRDQAGSLIGRPVLEFIHPANHERVRRDAGRRLSGEPATGLDEIRLVRVDGDATWAELLVTAIQHEGRPALLVSALDASARRRAEEEKEKLEAGFLQAQKMEAIGRLAGGVAHDFNNLLMAISGNTELLERRLQGQHSAHLAHIRKATELAAGLTQQLLAFSRKQVLRTEIVNLNEVVTATHKLLRRVIGEDIALELRLDAGLGTIRGDPGLIGQVLMNLGVNARDAMPQGGTLTIATAGVVVDTAGAGTPGLLPGRYVRLSVSDTGVGMSQDVVNRLFEPFFTTKERGTGLGLAMAYGAVNQSGGHIHAESDPGRGSTFHLHFPETQQPVGAAAADVGAAEAEPARGSETILVVEDDAEVREILESMLGGLGYRVLTAGEAAAAEKVFREQADTIHLLLTDVVLPGASGPELSRRFRVLRPGLAVLYASGYLDGESPGQSMPSDLLLRKPFTTVELAAAVRRVLDAAAAPGDARPR